jgi:hypothetical protein
MLMTVVALVLAALGTMLLGEGALRQLTGRAARVGVRVRLAMRMARMVALMFLLLGVRRALTEELVLFVVFIELAGHGVL